MPYGRPTHHPFGVTNAFLGDADRFGDFPAPDPTRVFQLYDDFLSYTSGQIYTLTEVGTGTDALAAGDFGTLLLTTTAAAADNEVIQSIATFRDQNALAIAKRLWFACRFQTDDATNAAITAGLFVTAASPITTPPTDGIRFLKAAGATTLSFVVTNGGVSTTIANVGSIATATNIELAFFYDINGVVNPGVGPAVYPYVNGVRTGRAPITNIPTSADALRLSFAVQAGTAVARTATVDYLFGACER